MTDTAMGSFGLSVYSAGGSSSCNSDCRVSCCNNDFGLLLTAGATGVCTDTGVGAGGFLGKNTLIPIVILGDLVSAEGTDGGMGVGSVGLEHIAMEAVGGILPGENGITLVDTLYIRLVCRA